MACQKSHHLPCDYSLFLPALILTTAVLSCLPGAPSAPGCLAASGRQLSGGRFPGNDKGTVGRPAPGL
ncbi:hypothetical protein [Escherichia coli]|uniref:hypothetical protein n=1 Tax=Escherichia coli TaxID=562 RepID=UPI000DD2FA71|nr:hypothetical protein [Escherichia coli]